MNNNEKSLWFLITIIGCAVIWLFLRNSKGGQDIINQISEAFNLPGLSSPAINVGDTGDYNIELAQMPSPVPDNSAGCCPTCQDVTIARGPRPPYELARPQPPVVYESIRYQTIYQPTPTRKPRNTLRTN